MHEHLGEFWEEPSEDHDLWPGSCALGLLFSAADRRNRQEVPQEQQDVDPKPCPSISPSINAQGKPVFKAAQFSLSVLGKGQLIID